jgi:hypothetical protein
MTAREKAKDLVDKYYQLAESIEWTSVKAEKFNDVFKYWNELAKKSALIAVNELLNNFLSNKTTKYGKERYHFWQAVKQEINKL